MLFAARSTETRFARTSNLLSLRCTETSNDSESVFAREACSDLVVG